MTFINKCVLHFFSFVFKFASAFLLSKNKIKEAAIKHVQKIAMNCDWQ